MAGLRHESDATELGRLDLRAQATAAVTATAATVTSHAARSFSPAAGVREFGRLRGGQDMTTGLASWSA